MIAQPSNQFASQEPLEGEALFNHITTRWMPVGDWVFLERADVNGDNATPLYEFLKNHPNCTSLFTPNMVMWNYEKFLIGRDGVPIMRARITTNPEDMEDDIIDALAMPKVV